MNTTVGIKHSPWRQAPKINPFVALPIAKNRDEKTVLNPKRMNVMPLAISAFEPVSISLLSF